MTIDSVTIVSLCYDDNKLCNYLSKIIQKLSLSGCLLKGLMKFCELFSNVEYLNCATDDQDDLIHLLNNLSKLIMFKVIT